ncbi:hypothetical protein ACWEP4_28065 [Streptomyces sp. NPDC004227]
MPGARPRSFDSSTADLVVVGAAVITTTAMISPRWMFAAENVSERG